MADKSPGAWMPWELVEAVCRLTLPRGAQWKILMALLFTQQRYGGRAARLKTNEIANMTGLGLRTVNRVLKSLVEANIVQRPRRYGVLKVNIDMLRDLAGSATTVALPSRPSSKKRSANVVALRKRHYVGASPTCLYVSLISMSSSSAQEAFSPKQLKLIDDVLLETAKLLEADPLDLSLREHHAQKLGLQPGHTYRHALSVIANKPDPVKARDFVAAVLYLRKDERVQGRELHDVKEGSG